MENIKEQVIELQKNQTYMLEAIKYLHERLGDMENKNSDLKDILDCQGTIDEILVKNCDDIHVIKRTKEENEISIKALDARIETINREIEDRTANLKTKIETVAVGVRDLESVVKVTEDIAKEEPCKYFNKGFCKRNKSCPFRHKSINICEDHVNGMKCLDKACERRHPKKCRYFLRGTCWRRESCVYLHKHNETSMNDDEMVLEKNEKYDFTERTGDKEIDSCDNEVDIPKTSDNENFEPKEVLSDTIHAAEETALVDRSVINSDFENCEDEASCDRCVMKEVLKELGLEYHF